MLLDEKNIKDLTIQVFHNCIAVSDIIDNQIIIKRYIGYTEKEAINLFISEFYISKNDDTRDNLNNYYNENYNSLYKTK